MPIRTTTNERCAPRRRVCAARQLVILERFLLPKGSRRTTKNPCQHPKRVTGRCWEGKISWHSSAPCYSLYFLRSMPRSSKFFQRSTSLSKFFSTRTQDLVGFGFFITRHFLDTRNCEHRLFTAPGTMKSFYAIIHPPKTPL